MTTIQVPQSIHATIHEDAINRVAGFFNAGTKDILNELLQNARRSGATRVDITTQPDRITVADDGAGIADPAAILAFGQSGWDNRAAQSEHAAGMGFYALARSERVRVSSRRRDEPAWQVDLTPDHFVGKLDAPVQRLFETTNPPGTTVTFASTKDPDRDIMDAARYYPLPVRVNGLRTEQANFLREAIHTEVWEGVRIGVYSDHRWSHIGRMNFHGIIVSQPKLPTISTIGDQWTAQVDVLDCPRLELTLPARREVIETPFMAELRTACRRAIYRALSLQPQAIDVPKKAQEEATSMGIILPDAAAVLQPWEAEPHDDNHGEPANRTWENISEDTIVMDLKMETPDQQALGRAAELNGAKGQLMKANKHLEGYDWYDRLTKAITMTMTVTTGGENQDLEALRESKKQMETQRPERIVFTLATVNSQGERSTVVLASDLAFENKEEEYMDGNRPLVTRESTIKVHELTDLMTDAFFCESDDRDADSYTTQRKDHEAAYAKIALTLLASEDDALKATLEDVITRHGIWEVPPGTVATIRITDGKTVEVTVERTGQETA